jgi:hypothetical protein
VHSLHSNAKTRVFRGLRCGILRILYFGGSQKTTLVLKVGVGELCFGYAKNTAHKTSDNVVPLEKKCASPLNIILKLPYNPK